MGRCCVTYKVEGGSNTVSRYTHRIDVRACSTAVTPTTSSSPTSSTSGHIYKNTFGLAYTNREHGCRSRRKNDSRKCAVAGERAIAGTLLYVLRIAGIKGERNLVPLHDRITQTGAEVSQKGHRDFFATNGPKPHSTTYNIGTPFDQNMVSKSCVSLMHSSELISTQTIPEKTTAMAGNKRQHPSRKVTFNEKSHETYDTYSRDEIQDSWYRESDYQAIQDELHSIGQMISCGVRLDDYSKCARGLEHYDRSVWDDLLHTRNEAISSVLRAQLQGKSIEEIALDYTVHTRMRSIKAYLQGIADEQQGKDIASWRASVGPAPRAAPTSVLSPSETSILHAQTSFSIAA